MFDILPNYGHLPPGEEQLVTIFFSCHENVSREVMAQCRVEEGPTYEIKLKGESSVISYSLDSSHIDFGLQVSKQRAKHLTSLSNSDVSASYVQIGLEAWRDWRYCYWHRRQDLPLVVVAHIKPKHFL